MLKCGRSPDVSTWIRNLQYLINHRSARVHATHFQNSFEFHIVCGRGGGEKDDFLFVLIKLNKNGQRIQNQEREKEKKYRKSKELVIYKCYRTESNDNLNQR